MSMGRLMSTMRAQAQMATQDRGSLRLGVVSGYDPATYSVKVQFQPDDSETGWIPIGALAVGSGWGVLAPPVLGDQVAVLMQDSDPDAGVAALRLFTDEDVPPAVPSGEIWALHKSGAFFKLTNDGKATFSDGHGATVALNGDGTISSTGAWKHTGAMEITSTLKVDGATTLAGVTSNGHDVGSTHQHLNSGGTGLGGVPQ
jgi:phage baseplate assembly protein V